MNQIKHLFLLVSSIFICTAHTASAHDFIVDGIYYNIISQSDRTCEVTSNPDCYDGSIEIPEFVDYGRYTYKVTAIGDHAFNERYSRVSYVTDISLPNTIERIGQSAFYCCGGLTSINLPKSLKVIDNNAFSDCLNLLSIEIPNSVEKIGSWSFQNCWSLKNVMIEPGNQHLLNIPYRSFSGSGYDLNLHIGRSLDNEDYGELKISPVKLDIADKIDIGNFFRSDRLKDELRILNIGKEIKGFPSDLSDFSELIIFQINDDIPPSCPVFTDHQFSSIRLVVPDGAIDSYKQDKEWGKFDDIVESSSVEYTDIYLTGSMNAWTHSNAWKFTAFNKEATMFRFLTAVPQKINYADEFKITSKDWTTINYGVQHKDSRIAIDRYTRLTKDGNSWNCQLESDRWYGVCWLDITSGQIIFSKNKDFIPDFNVDGVEYFKKESNNKKKQYYNINGIEMSDDMPHPGLYIIKSDNETKKIVIR